LLILAILTVTGIGLAVLLSRILTKPILALHRGTEEIMKGDLDYKVGTKAKDEIGQLSRAFDEMAVSLKKSRDELEEYSKGLEKIVAARTAELVKANEELTHEIDQRKRADETLRESEERYRALVEAGGDMGEAIILLQGTDKAEAAHLFANDEWARMTGYTPEELKEISFHDLVHPRHRDAIADRLRRRFQGELLPGPWEISIIAKDGTELPVETTGIHITYQGKPTIVGHIHDITERKQAEQEREALLEDIKEINRRLERSNHELQDFAYVASHDLREPMRKIASFGMLLQDSLEGKLDEDQQENFEFMIDGAKRMQAMIDNLLAYSRLTTKARPLKQVNLNDVIGELKKLELATLLDETKGTIHIPQPLPSVQGDPSQIRQLLQNLVGNGLKFHREGVPPEITIRAHQIDDSMVELEVQDNGIGIAEEYHKQIFTMFKRLHSRERYGGTGIGLAVCQKIVERHGGNIGVKSTPGEGSTFWFTLPREAAQGTKSERGDDHNG